MAILLMFLIIITPGRAVCSGTELVFAVIGDYGTGDNQAAAVATLVNSWNPAFVIATGDDYRAEAGGSGDEKYDLSTGRFYCSFLSDISTSGTFCPPPGQAAVNRFFPSLGNHDYSDTGDITGLPETYTQYFSLPGIGVTSSATSGNERYYDFIQGPIHFFVLNSNPGTGLEPDGIDKNSIQAAWLKRQLELSSSSWNIVYMHHPSYSSGTHGPTPWMQWPFSQWGADIVISGHDHDYERIHHDGIEYFINGTGGAPLTLCSSALAEGSRFCWSGSGAQRITATTNSLEIEFITIDGIVRDQVQVGRFTHRIFLPYYMRS